MLMTRWNPVLSGELTRFHEALNRLLDGFAGRTASPGLTGSYPPVNVWQDADNVYAEAELPGLERDHVEVYVTEGDQLTIRGRRQAPEQDTGVWHRLERGFGDFSRTLMLPVQVEADKVEARLEHGVLHLTLPKSEAVRPRRITVKAE